MNEDIMAEIRKLREESAVAYVGSVNEGGYPLIKAMFVVEHDSLQVQYFSTNLSSKRVQQFLKNPKASVYYCNEQQVKGVLFTGTMEVCQDHDTKALLWHEGDEKYYPKGVDDDDYCVLKFTTDWVSYYHGLNNITLSI